MKTQTGNSVAGRPAKPLFTPLADMKTQTQATGGPASRHNRLPPQRAGAAALQQAGCRSLCFRDLLCRRDRFTKNVCNLRNATSASHGWAVTGPFPRMKETSGSYACTLQLIAHALGECRARRKIRNLSRHPAVGLEDLLLAAQIEEESDRVRVTEQAQLSSSSSSSSSIPSSS
jgi:hypothetical protein